MEANVHELEANLALKSKVRVSDFEAREIALCNQRNQEIVLSAKVPLEKIKAETAELDWILKKITGELHVVEQKIEAAKSQGNHEEKPRFNQKLVFILKLLACIGTAIFDANVLGNSGFSSLESWSLGFGIALIAFLLMEFAGGSAKQGGFKDKTALVGWILALLVALGMAWSAADIRTKSTIEAEEKKQNRVELDQPSVSKEKGEVKSATKKDLPITMMNYLAIGFGLVLGQFCIAFFTAQKTHALENDVKGRDALKRKLNELNIRRTKLAEKYQPLWSTAHHKIQANHEYCLAVIYAYRHGVRLGWNGGAPPSFMKAEIPVTVFRHPKLPPQMVSDHDTFQANVESAFQAASDTNKSGAKNE